MKNLLKNYFSGELSPLEKKELFKTLAEDAELKSEFIRMQNLKGLIGLTPFEDDKAMAQNKLDQFWKEIRKQQIRSRILHFSKYAAAIVVIILSSLLVRYSYMINKTDSLYSEIEVPAGQRVFLTLDDGSTVWLNSRTRLKIPRSFGRKERKIYLDGEAYFDVAKDKNKPFIVQTSRCDVEVLGTRFNVLNYSEMAVFETTLIEGKVQITKNETAQKLKLCPNEQVVLKNNQLVKQRVNGTDFSSWKDGLLVFELSPLEEIIKKLELYYDVKFIVRNEASLKDLYTGKFKTEDTAFDIIDAMHKANKFTYRVSPDKKIIYIQ